MVKGDVTTLGENSKKYKRRVPLSLAILPQELILMLLPGCLKVGVLFSALLMAGCSQAFASLHFDNPVDGAYQVPGYSSRVDYKTLLLNEMANAGVAIENVRVEPDSQNRYALRILLRGMSPDPDKQEKIRRFLEARLADRQAARFAATLQMYPEKSVAAKTGPTSRPPRLPAQMVLTPTGKSRVEILRKGSWLELTLAKESEMHCEFLYSLETAMPFAGIEFLSPDERSDSEGVNARVSTVDYQNEVPASLTFHDSNLMRLVESGEVEVRTVNAPMKRGPAELGFSAGKLGRNSHQAGYLSAGTLQLYRSQCEVIASHLGRPFSFTMGNSLDRLSSVTFHR